MSLPPWAATVSLTGRIAAGVIFALYALQAVAPGVRTVLGLVPARCVWRKGGLLSRFWARDRRQQTKSCDRRRDGERGGDGWLARPLRPIQSPIHASSPRPLPSQPAHRVLPRVWQFVTSGALEKSLVTVR